MARKAAKKKGTSSGVPLPILILMAAVVAVFTWRLMSPSSLEAKHPSPRAGVTADAVLVATHFSEPDIAEAYQMAKEIPEILDGLYCHCDCSRHSGHRSLLTCFESEHGSGCDICMGEARLAYRMHKDGKSLEEIRTAIDASFGQG